MENVQRPCVTGSVTNDADEARFAVFRFIFVADGKLLATVQLHLGGDPARASRRHDLPRARPGAAGRTTSLIQVEEIPKPSS